MPGEDYQSWSTTAASNGNSDSLIDWHEGQARASVNNSSRSEMAAHAKNRNLLNGSIVTFGTTNAQQFLSGVSYTAVPTGLVVKLKIGAGLTNVVGSLTTLNMDSIGDVEIKTADGISLKGNELMAGAYVDLLYNGTNWIFLYSREYIQFELDGGGGVIIGTQIFKVAGTFTYTPTPGTECSIIECVGGGGGSGDVAASAGNLLTGGGGGSGGYSRKVATAAQIGGSQTINVGAGGAGGVPGATGGDTSVGALCIAKGGGGGGSSLNGATVPLGGLGGVAGTGDIAAAGSPGEQGGYVIGLTGGNVIGGGGRGGSSYLGGGAQIPAVGVSGSVAGIAAGNYGSGGSGAISNQTGGYVGAGAGSSGIVIITEFAGRGSPGRDGDQGPIGPAGPSGDGTGDVLRSGTPTAGQMAQWTDASHIAGVSAASIGVITSIAIQKFTASGTYTPTTGMKSCIIECVGGGSGGGGVVGDLNFVLGAGGGGAGGYSRKLATAADVGASQAVTVGSGGTVSIGAGGAGGSTSVGTLCVANGGVGGGATTTALAGVGGPGASAGVGDVAATGAAGHNGFYWNGAPTGFIPPAGAGGNSYYGGGGVAGQGLSTGPATGGKNATGYGGGGGGASANNCNASNTANGGTGSPGLVVITEFI